MSCKIPCEDQTHILYLHCEKDYNKQPFPFTFSLSFCHFPFLSLPTVWSSATYNRQGIVRTKVQASKQARKSATRFPSQVNTRADDDDDDWMRRVKKKKAPVKMRVSQKKMHRTINQCPLLPKMHASLAEMRRRSLVWYSCKAGENRREMHTVRAQKGSAYHNHQNTFPETPI